MTKITLITGASRGLGRNTALSIARHGGDVIVTYQSRAEDAQAVVAEIQAMGRKAVALQLDTGDMAALAPFADAAASGAARDLAARHLRPPRQQCRPRRHGASSRRRPKRSSTD